jgi:ATP-dependent Clp protease protease subunit
MNGTPNQPPNPTHSVLGFNLIIDRIATMRLMSAVGGAMQQGAKALTLCISSIGGSPEQAFYAYEMLKVLPIPIITHNVGVVHSAAMYIFLAGSKRFAVPHANFLMHKTIHSPPPGSSYGLDHLDYSGESIIADDERSMAIVAEQTKQETDVVRTWFSGQQLRSAEFALEHGFIEKIMPVQFPAQSQFFQVSVG